MKRELVAALSELERVDARIDARSVARHSLDPAGRRARPLRGIAEDICGEAGAPAAFAAAFCQLLAKIAEAQLEAFPGNIFWDFELLAHRLFVGSHPARDGALERLTTTADLIVRLQERFGSEPIHFRYAHDFVYGFDWARWVSKQPETRSAVGPFDDPFLRALLERGEELVELIARDDPRYPKLDAAAPRNSFGFSREPEHETRLLLELARRQAVPVEAWRTDAAPRWDRPYHELRERLAVELGIPRAE